MIRKEIISYCEKYSKNEDEVLSALRRETHLKTLHPHMISGPLQGQFITSLVQMKKPKLALEIGTFTGYAAICMARGLPSESILHTLEINPELKYFHDKYFTMANLSHNIKVHIGDSNQIIPTLEDSFDFVFMDAGKKDYKSQYQILIKKMSSGGVILADNTLWKGKVIADQKDKMSTQLHEFNMMVAEDARVDNVILPIRDGINMITKK